jgi:hypothetical protein
MKIPEGVRTVGRIANRYAGLLFLTGLVTFYAKCDRFRYYINGLIPPLTVYNQGQNEVNTSDIGDKKFYDFLENRLANKKLSEKAKNHLEKAIEQCKINTELVSHGFYEDFSNLETGFRLSTIINNDTLAAEFLYKQIQLLNDYVSISHDPSRNEKAEIYALAGAKQTVLDSIFPGYNPKPVAKSEDDLIKELQEINDLIK